MTRNGQRLLMLIDDEPAQRRLVSAIAARREWRSVFAADGETAIAMLGTQDGMQLDAILLDSFGPESEAEDLIRELRLRRPQLPILMLTANGSVAQAVAAMRAGATDFLVKPFAADRLLSALEAVVAGTDAGELRPLTEKIPALLGFDEIVGAAPDFRAALDEKLLLARYFYQEIQSLGFEVGPPPDLSIVTFRWAPPGIAADRGDRVNQEIVDGVRRDGRVFLSSTMLDGRFTLRLAVLAFRTHRKTIDLAIRVLREQIRAIGG